MLDNVIKVQNDGQFCPQTPYFMLVIKFVPDVIKKCIRNCKDMLKRVFGTLLWLKTEQKSRIDQNAKRGTY